MLEIKDVKFDVSITQKRIRNIYLRVDGTKVIVTAPKYVPLYEIYNFIDTKRDWIYKSYLYSMYKKQNTLKYNGGDIFYIFNKPYNLVFVEGNKRVNIVDDNVYLYSRNNDVNYLYKYLNNTLLNKANEYLDKYMYMLTDYGYNNRPLLSAKLLKGKWGVCFTRENKINISSYLIHYPFECLEYIIIHELTHFIVPNHSKRFYEIIEHNMSNYKEANNRLKL